MVFKNIITKSLIAIAATLAINYIASIVSSRVDITKDKRYTISEATKKVISATDDLMYIDVYLTGDMPSEFKRLEAEVKILLEEFSEVNDHIIINFENLKKEGVNLEEISNEMLKFGIPPLKVDSQENGKVIQETIFPWAVINYNKKIRKSSSYNHQFQQPN
jgi:ABC-type uncharacterized transport system involved in gliding motility auxiliary subunit